MTAIDAVDFPANLAYGSSSGPRYSTAVERLGSGFERRNRNWARAVYEFDAAPSITQQDALNTLVAFFHGCGGRATGFLFKDRSDFTSAANNVGATSATNQAIGTGDGVTANFQLIKTYSNGVSSSTRKISRPVSGTVKIAVAAVVKTITTHFTVDTTTGIITFTAGNIPTAGQAVTAGFEFRIPARFDTDFLETAIQTYTIYHTAAVPIIEVRE